jgi:hypothetical protein
MAQTFPATQPLFLSLGVVSDEISSISGFNFLSLSSLFFRKGKTVALTEGTSIKIAIARRIAAATLNPTAIAMVELTLAFSIVPGAALDAVGLPSSAPNANVRETVGSISKT